MAETFKSVTSAGIGTASTAIYTCPASTTTVVLGFLVANATNPAADISVSSTLTKSGGSACHVIRGVNIFAGASLSISGENNKLVLETGDALAVSSDVASSADVTLSILEIT
jgi:hypothetical protein